VSIPPVFLLMLLETDPFGCLASGLCLPNPEGPLPPGTSGLLFTALGLVALGALFNRARQPRE
jgi:hypothetical protein